MASVVIQFGPDVCYAGIAGEKAPKLTFSRKELGFDKSCDDLNKVVKHAFDTLNVNGSDRKIMFVAPPLADKGCREKIGKTLFEGFKVPAAFMVMDAVTSCYAVGQMNAIVIQSNEKGVFLVPVKDGYAVPSAIQKGLNLEDAASLADKVETAINTFDAGLRDQFYQKVVLAGAKTKSDDLPKALEAELKKKNANAAVIAPESREHSAWIGGSILASVDDMMKDLWITSEMYGQKGVAIMHAKCNFQTAPAIVVQFGPDICYAGISGDSAPKLTFSRKELGFDKSCDDLNKVIKHAFDTLNVNGSDRKIMFVAPPLADKGCREKIGKTLFEGFKVPAAYMVMDALTSGFAAGQMSAIVIQSNEKGVFLVPVKDGYAVPSAIQKGLNLEDAASLADNVETAINTFDAGLRDHFYQTVVLAGAQTMSADLPKALEAELKKKNANAAVIAPESREHSAWIGGSILASVDDMMKDLWITSEMYGQKGVDIMHEKCNFQVGKQ